MRKLRKRYIVDGAYLDGNEGTPVTSDVVVAETEEEAEEIVSKARDRTGDWMFDRAVTFEEYMIQERKNLERMEKETLEEVENRWKDTLKSLGYRNGVVEEEEED